MLLDHYIAREGCGYAGFGLRLDPPMSKGDVWNLAKGKRGVSMPRGKRICDATGGAVTLEDLQAPFEDGFVMPEPPANGGGEHARDAVA